MGQAITSSHAIVLGHVVMLGHVVILLLWNVGHVRCDGPVVDTEKGKVRGFTETIDEKKVDVFYGIPFAAPPLGELRYRPPVQNEPWTDTLDATRLPNSCFQGYDTHFGNFSGTNMWNPVTTPSEDCLYLNVWVPRTDPPSTDPPGKSVIVWIYGGAFYSGSSTLEIYEASYLAAENDIIVVSLQYRLGTLGFLALDTVEAPGNAGIWDQRMALEWVSRNIHNFGGNPNSVTLMGESAGAASVGVFLLCELCGGLFHRAILQSGAPQAVYAVKQKEIVAARSKKFAESVGCGKQSDDEYIVRCLRDLTYTNEVLGFEGATTEGAMQPAFVPIVDGVLIRQEPAKLLRDGNFKKVPILVGSTENEGTYFMVYSFYGYQLQGEPDFNSSRYLEFINYFIHSIKPNEYEKEAIAFHYRDWLNPENQSGLIASLDRAISDGYFVCPVNELARAYSREGQPVYYYWFSQRWSATPWPEWMGVLHGDEIWFTFGHPLNRSHSFTEEERKLSRMMMAYWTNFAKTGDPNQTAGDLSLPEWPVFKHNEQLYLNLSVGSFASGHPWGQGPRTQHCAFWDEYLPKLQTQTSNAKNAEKDWEKQFQDWKTQYIVDWRVEFDKFLDSYERRSGLCDAKIP